jgi:tetratricopeptide (TPR) repeat protein
MINPPDIDRAAQGACAGPIDDLKARVKGLLAKNDNAEAYEILKKDLPQLQAECSMSRSQVADLQLELQELFLDRNDIARSAEIVKAASENFLATGATQKAAEAYYSYAEKLFKSGIYGWAGTRYYNAAVIYLEQGNLDEARAYLERALKRFKEIPNEFWTQKLEKHLAILQPSQPLKEKLLQLSQLQLDFRNMSRENWVEACKSGSLKLLREPAASASPG